MGGQGGGPGRGLPGTLENGAFVGINSDGQGKINFGLHADRHNPDIVYISGDDQPAWNEVNPDPTRPPFPNQIGASDHWASIFRGDASKVLSGPPAVPYWRPDIPYNGQWLPITDYFSAGGTTPHADSRSLALDAHGHLLETNDGGIYRRSDPRSSTGLWTSLIGNLQVTEMFSVSYDNNTGTLISGNQDTGSGQQTSVNGTPSLVWQAQLGADGGKTAINDSGPAFSVRYLSEQRLGKFTRVKVHPNNTIAEVKATRLLVRKEDGATVPLDAYEANQGSTIPNQAPLRVNQADKSLLAFGTQFVYKATDDVSGTLSNDLVLTPLHKKFDSQVGDIAYGRPGNRDLLLVGEGSKLWLSTTLEVGSLKQLDKYPGAETVTGVFINPNSDNQFYVADGATLRSTGDQGATWLTGLSSYQLRSLQFITNGLNAVMAGGYGTLYAARDTDLDNWFSLKGNLPNTFVWDMDYSSQDDTLAVGTLGRGAFTLANASTLMPVKPASVDRDWIRLLRSDSGSQTINGGTLQTPEPLANWGHDLTLTALGGTFDTAQSDSTLSGVIAGPGSFTIGGSGVLALRGANTYAGGTLVNGGTVNVAGDANLGAASGGLSLEGGTLQTAAHFTSPRGITLLPNGGVWDTSASTPPCRGLFPVPAP